MRIAFALLGLSSFLLSSSAFAHVVPCTLSKDGRSVQIRSESLKLSAPATGVQCEVLRESGSELVAIQSNSQKTDWKGRPEKTDRLEVFSKGKRVESLALGALSPRWKTFKDPKSGQTFLVLRFFENEEYQYAYFFDPKKAALLDWTGTAEKNGWPKEP